jgi:hypothetical protein
VTDAPPPPPAPPTLRLILRRSAAAAWANRYPALALQLFAIVIGVGYATSEAVRDVFAHITELREQVGILFPLFSTALFAGFLPWLIQWLRPTTRAGATLGSLTFLLLVWAWKGAEADLLYRGQEWLVGDGRDPVTLALKTLIDQTLYAPLWGLPTLVFAFRWRGHRYQLAGMMREIRHGGGFGRWFRQYVLPVLVPNAMIWPPAVIVIYSLPLPLQLPMQNLVACFWSAMLILLTEPGRGPEQA